METQQASTVVAVKQSSHPQLRTASAIVLSIIGCWALYASLISAGVYRFGHLPLSDLLRSYLSISGFLIGSLLLYISSRLWPRWRVGIGTVALIEGALAGCSSAVGLLDVGGRTPIALSIVATSIMGTVVGLALIIWQKSLHRRLVRQSI